MQNHKKIFSIIIVLLFSINATDCPPKKEPQEAALTQYKNSSADAIAGGGSGSAAGITHSLINPDVDVSRQTYSEWFFVAYCLRMTKDYSQENLVDTYTKLQNEIIRLRSKLTELPEICEGELFKLIGMFSFVCLQGSCQSIITLTTSPLSKEIIEQSFRNGFSSTHKLFKSFVEENFNIHRAKESLRNVSLVAFLTGGLLKYDILKFLQNHDYVEVT
jgi:hypothetical protein